MKIALYICLLLSTVIPCPVVGDDDLPPPMDPSQPVYQQDGRGFLWICKDYKEVTPLSPEEIRKAHEDAIEQARRQKLWKAGFWMLVVGLPMFFAGFFMSAVLSQYGLQMIAHFLSPTGLTFACSGAFLMELAEMWVIVTVGVLALIIYGVASYLLRNRGIEVKNPLKRRPKK